MRCERAEQIDLDAFLLGVKGDEVVDAFREHYPHCAACAAAVGDWMALDTALRAVMAEAGEPAAHPDPEELAHFADAPARLGAEAAQVERHLASCASCANELRLIQGFDPAMFGGRSEAMPAVARERAEREAGRSSSLREALVGFLEQLRRFDLWSPAPALALAVVVLAGLWLSGALEGLGGGRSESRSPQLVEGSEPSARPDEPLLAARPEAMPEPEPLPERAPELERATEPAPTRPEELAQAELAPPRAEVPAPTEPMPADSVELAQTEPAPEAAASAPAPREHARAVEPDVRPSTGPAASARPDEILLAAVTELPVPDYAAPAGVESLDWMRAFGVVRSAPGAAKVSVRAPGDHTGLTLSRTPRLWWVLDQPTDLPIQLTLSDAESIDPLVRVELPGPHAAGLHAFDLEKQGARLSPDVDYRWFVSVVVDPERPSRNPVSAGSLRVVGLSDARRQAASAVEASARGNAFAELGLWYDAFDFYASLAAAHPEVEQLAAYRDRLVEAAARKP